MIYIILKTIITAIVVVAISEIVKRSSLFAAIIASIPLTSFLAFIWIYWETKDIKKIEYLSYNIILMVIPSFVFFIVLPLALRMQVSFLISMLLAVISTIIAYWIFIVLLSKIGIYI